MHACLEDLISLRDDEPVDAGLAAHVAHCDSCTQELQRLRKLREQLRRLPSFDPPPLSPALPVPRTVDPARQPAPARSWLPYATAASVVLTVFAVLWSLVERAPSEAPVASYGADPQLESLVSRSQQLEAMLRDLPPRPAVERATTSATIEELQARIELVDSQLLVPQEAPTDSEQVQQLWGERVLLMNSLVSMRYAEAARVGYVSYNHRGEL